MKIKIGESIYNIKRVDCIIPDNPYKEETFGFINHLTKRIFLMKKRNWSCNKCKNKRCIKRKFEESDILYHEIVHGIFNQIIKEKENRWLTKRFAEHFNKDEQFVDYFSQLLKKSFKIRKV